MKKFGFVRVGAYVNKLALANPLENTKEIIKGIKDASKKGVAIISTPELALTGYSCGDLFLQDKLINGAEDALKVILKDTGKTDIISIIGMPVKVGNNLLSCAVVINKGNILGVVPKNNLGKYNGYDELRWFKNGNDVAVDKIILANQEVNFGNNLVFRDVENTNISFGIEFGNDLNVVNASSDVLALSGANIIFNLASSNEIIGRCHRREELVKMQPVKLVAGYVYASCGMMESSSDVLFSGASMIYENGEELAKNERFDLNSSLIIADIDCDRVANLRMRDNNYVGNNVIATNVDVKVSDTDKFDRVYKDYPFVPIDKSLRDERCREIFTIQSCALARRLVQLNYPKCILGISGGLDSTLAFLVVVEAYKKLGLDMKNIVGVTMPGFGTTGRTYNNACKFVEEYGATLKEVSIKDAAIQHMKDIGLDENDRSVAYENLQARERTQILMDIANMENGFVIGTGDLSELALGWCTYNGDHMSMYGVNGAIPKTLVRYLVDWVADNADDGKKQVLKDILDTPISPELLPPDKAGNILQQTESSIGPYVLHDFFLYHFLRYGATPKKVYYLAKHTFNDNFDDEVIKKWLKVFVRRFFTQQFKRNCCPDGVKVGSVGLSPRGDLVMPSDALYGLWMMELDELDKED